MTWSLLAWSSQPRRDAQSQSFTSWSMWDRKRVTSPRRHLEKEGGGDEGSWPHIGAHLEQCFPAFSAQHPWDLCCKCRDALSVILGRVVARWP